MSTSGYYDEIAKVEALRQQRIWRFRRRQPARSTSNANTNAPRKRSRPRRPTPVN